MEQNNEKLKRYVLMNSQYWIWPPDIYHEVVFLGCEQVDFKFKNGSSVPTMRYRFRLNEGIEKPIDVRSLRFAEKMSHFQAEDKLKVKRTKISKNEYNYDVFKID